GGGGGAAGVGAGAGWIRAGVGRRAAPAGELGGPARAARAPIRLVDAIEAAPSTPEAIEKRDAPPPIIREPERKPDPPRKARRMELQEELFGEDTYRLPPVSLPDPPQKHAQPVAR